LKSVGGGSADADSDPDADAGDDAPGAADDAMRDADDDGPSDVPDEGEPYDAGSAPGERRAVRRLRALVLAEVLVAVVILGVTSVLVQTTPGRSAAAGPAAAPSVQSATMRDKLFILTVDVSPAAVGINDVHLYATTPDGQPADIKEWTVRAAAPAQGIEPIDANVLSVTPDHAIGTIGIPTAGTWTFTFTLRTTEIDQSTVTTQVIVNP
jgi:copper transport protein